MYNLHNFDGYVFIKNFLKFLQHNHYFGLSKKRLYSKKQVYLLNILLEMGRCENTLINQKAKGRINGIDHFMLQKATQEILSDMQKN